MAGRLQRAVAGMLALLLSGAALASEAVPSGKPSPLPAGMDDPASFHERLVDFSGAAVVRFRDVGIAAPREPLTIERTYRSDFPQQKGFGPGWQWTYGVSLAVTGPGAIEIAEADGTRSSYARAGDVYRARQGRADTTVTARGGGHVRTFQSGDSETFDAQGRLIERRRGGVVAVTIEHRPGQMIVSDAAQRRLTIALDNDRVRSVVDPLGRQTSYDYDGAGRLQRVTDPLKRSTTLLHDRRGRLVGVRPPDFRVLAIVYDERGAVTLLQGPGPIRTFVTVSGEPGLARIEMTDAEGRKTTREFARDPADPAQPAVLAHIDGAGNRSAVEFRPQEMRFVLPDGGTAALQVDGKGVAMQFRDALGATTDLRAVAPGGKPAPQPSVDKPAVDKRGYPTALDIDGERHPATFDDAGRLTELRHPGGRRETLEHDAGDRLVRRVDPFGAETRFWYDHGNRLLTVRHPSGHDTHITYGWHGLPRHVDYWEAPSHRRESFDYDNGGLLTRETRRGLTTQFEYDPARRLQAMVDHAGNRWTFAYDARGKVTTIVTDRGRRIAFAYDANGRLTGIDDGERSLSLSMPRPDLLEIAGPRGRVDRLELTAAGMAAAPAAGSGEAAPTVTHSPDGNATEMAAGERRVRLAYTGDDRAVTVTMPSGGQWSIERDERGRPVRMTSTAGAATTFTYTGRGDVASVTDSRGVRRDFTYDQQGGLVAEGSGDLVTRFQHSGRLNAVIAPDGARVDYAYGADGSLASRTVTHGPLKQAWQFEYNRFGDLARVVHPDGVVETRQYDNRGRLQEVAHGDRVTRYRHDADGGGTAVDHAGIVTRFAYDAAGRIVGHNGRPVFEYEGSAKHPAAEIDALGRRWTHSYNPHGNVVATTDPAGATLRRAWNAGGVLVAQEDDDGRRIVITRDRDDRQTGLAIAGGPATQYDYDAHGALAAVRKAGGATIAYERDAQGRLAAERVDGRDAARFSYDRFGRVTAVADTIGKHAFAYDEAGQLLAVTDAFGRIIRYEYDTIGRRIAMISPEGERTEYRYGADGRLAGLKGADGRETTFAWLPRGVPSQIVHADGSTAAFAYDGEGRVARVRWTDRQGTVRSERSIARNAAGEIVAVTTGGRTTQFRYDTRGWLAGATAADGRTAEHAFDRSGNPTTFNGTPRRYNQAFQLDDIAGTPVTHDRDGNLQSIGSQLRLEHDVNGRVIAATVAGRLPVHYRYDFEGRLVERRQGDAVVRYLYDGMALVGAYDGTGRRLSWIERQPVPIGGARIHRADGVATLQADDFGTPLAVTDAGGRTADISLSPWGEAAAAEPLRDGLIGFTGALQDHETGLVFFGARAYRPALGRFTAPDPAGIAGGHNPYAYAANNPLRFADQAGTQPYQPSLTMWERVRPRPGGSRRTFGDVDAAGRVFANLDEISRTDVGRPAGQAAGQAMLLFYTDRARLVIHDRLPPEFQGAGWRPHTIFGMFDPARPDRVNVYQYPHRLTARPGTPRADALQGMTGNTVHELSHLVRESLRRQGHGALPAPAEEFEARLFQHITDPRTAGQWVDNRPRTLARFVAAQMDQLRGMDGYREWRRMLPDMLEEFDKRYGVFRGRGLNDVVADANRELRDIEDARDRPRRVAERARSAADTWPDGPRRSAAGAPDMSRNAVQEVQDARHAARPGMPAGVNGMVYGALNGIAFGLGMFNDAIDYMEGRQSTGQFVANNIANALPLVVPALAGPVGAAMFAHGLGNMIGQAAADAVLPYVRDPGSWGGEFIRQVTGLPAPGGRFRGHACSGSIDCDCDNVLPACTGLACRVDVVAARMRSACRQCQEELIEACVMETQSRGYSDGASRAGGTCGSRCGKVGPRASP
ncbi:MAG: hypothetical protein K2Y71_04995 [Xanthobacteraceae bacterium]|nr:hypothetical protein [Xanthobacteraceae bacterium]